MICGLEVVMADGSSLRTGMGHKNWNLQESISNVNWDRLFDGFSCGSLQNTLLPYHCNAFHGVSGAECMPQATVFLKYNIALWHVYSIKNHST